MATHRPRSKRMHGAALVLALVCGALGVAEFGGWLEPDLTRPAHVPQSPTAIQTVADAYRRRRSDVPVEFEARVTRILPDDDVGARHQRLVVQVDGFDHTLLIAHNLDLAPRVVVAVGDVVAVRGDYVWNAQGGVVHWTHADPAGRHRAGSLQVRSPRGG